MEDRERATPPKFGEHIPENDKPYKVVKINYRKRDKDRMPKPLSEEKGEG